MESRLFLSPIAYTMIFPYYWKVNVSSSLDVCYCGLHDGGTLRIFNFVNQR